MNDNKYIKYRLFTTASPNKEFVLSNINIYGELYEPIRFKSMFNKKINRNYTRRLKFKW